MIAKLNVFLETNKIFNAKLNGIEKNVNNFLIIVI